MPKGPPKITHALAERHEALWLRLSALHASIAAIAAKKPDVAVGEVERVAAEGLLGECWPFLRSGMDRLPVASAHFAGLTVQLSQALALLDVFETRHTVWSTSTKCRAWRLQAGELPVMRLRPQLVPEKADFMGRDIQDLLAKQFRQRWKGAYEQGFKAGRDARDGRPVAPVVEPDYWES